ncbi:MAG: universal stress protein [Polyangiaceae bacterium]|nr:universal stress protein [Polyangiaceae bacterium]
MAAIEIRKILVGLDSSPRASNVIETALALAQRFGSQLILCNAVGIPFDFPADALGLSPTALPGIMEEAARRDLEARARSLPPDVPHKVDVQIGTPWQVICNLAKEEDVDLIVIGSHGYSGLDRVIGTTAARVVNHADRPVMVVRAKAGAGA